MAFLGVQFFIHFYFFITTAVTFHIISIGSTHGRDALEVIDYFVPMAFVSVTSNILMGLISSRTGLTAISDHECCHLLLSHWSDLS